MKLEKQNLVLKILGAGKYMISVEDGGVYSWRSKKKRFELLVPTILKGSGYLQYTLHLGRHENTSVRVYGHHLVWLSVHGTFSEKDRIIHITKGEDELVMSNGIRNLQKIENFASAPKETTEAGIRTIRKEEIAKIKYMVELGERNCSKIARDLGLNRLSVRRTVKKILAGEELKYENKEVKSKDKVYRFK